MMTLALLRTSFVAGGLTLLLAVLFAQPLQSENIAGNGSRGPYYLSFENIVEKSESIFVDGRWLARGKEYDVDYESGRVAFRQAVGRAQQFRAVYQTSSRSRKSAKRSELPVSLGLYRYSGAEFGLQGNFAQGAAGGSATVGFFARYKGDGSSGEAAYLMENPSSTAPSLIKAKGDWSEGRVRASASLVRAEKEFQNAKGEGGEAGKQHLKANFVWDANDRLTARASYAGVSGLDANATVKDVWNLSMAYRTAGSRFSAERSISDQTGQEPRIFDRYMVEANATDIVKVRYERAENRTGEELTSQEDTVSATASNGRGAARISHTFGRVGELEHAATSVGLSANGKRGGADLSLTETSKGELLVREAAAKANAQIDPALKIGGELLARDTQGSAIGFSAALSPAPNVGFIWRQREYDGYQGYNAASRTAEATWSPTRGVSLKSSFTERPEDKDGRLMDAERFAQEAAVSLGPWRYSLGYGQTRSISADLTTNTYSLGAQRKIDPYTLFSLRYDHTEIERAIVDDPWLRQAAIKLGLVRRVGTLDLQLEASAFAPDLNVISDNVRYGGSIKLGKRF